MFAMSGHFGIGIGALEYSRGQNEHAVEGDYPQPQLKPVLLLLLPAILVWCVLHLDVGCDEFCAFVYLCVCAFVHCLCT